MSTTELTQQLEKARAAYQKDQKWESSEQVKKLQAQISASITEGAKPCPLCKRPPHGMEQPADRGKSVEYEIGCLGCKPFVHTDGTTRRPAVRGGLLPAHAIEAWNAGPDHWMRV